MISHTECHNFVCHTRMQQYLLTTLLYNSTKITDSLTDWHGAGRVGKLLLRMARLNETKTESHDQM